MAARRPRLRTAAARADMRFPYRRKVESQAKAGPPRARAEQLRAKADGSPARAKAERSGVRTKAVRAREFSLAQVGQAKAEARGALVPARLVWTNLRHLETPSAL